MHFLKKGQKIWAWVDPPPPIQAIPKRKRFFLLMSSLIIKNCSFCPLKLSLEYLDAVLTRNKKGRYLHLKYLDEYEKCDDV